MTESAPIAGWYEDPLSPSAVRWWNGRGWTEHTQAPAAAVSVGGTTRPIVRESAPAASVPAAPVSAPGRNEYVPMRGHAGGPDRTSAAPAARDWLRPTHWSTPGVWAMSFTPWFSTAIAFALGVLVAVGARWYVLLAAVLLIPLLWIAFAVRDRRRLLELGYDKRASWAWVLLSPLAYLIARGVRVHRSSGRGWAPLWVLLANIVIVAGADLGVSMVVQAAVLPQQIHSLESTIASDYATHGVAATVTCPTSGVSLRPGASFQCTAADTIGRTESIAVRVSAAGRVSYAPATDTPGF
jgi:hypothetical protein